MIGNTTGNETTQNKTDPTSADVGAWQSEVLFGALIVAVNVIALIILSRSRRMIPQIRFLSMNLASSDLFTGIMISYHGIIFTGANINNKYLCFIYLYSLPGTMVVSMNTIFLFAADRFFAIYYQMTYIKFMTRVKIIFMCLCTWFAAAIALASWYAESLTTYKKKGCINRDYIDTGGGLVGLTTWGISSFIFTVLCYLGIYLAVRRQLNRVGPDSAVKKINLKQLLKPTIQISIVAGSFFITYIPSYISTVYMIVHPDRIEEFYYPAVYGTYTFATLNSVVNPFLYVWRFTECRYELAMLFCYCNPTLIQKIKAKRNRLHAEFLQETKVQNVM